MTRKQEIEAVKALGDQIGYGNMMSIASGLWAIMLKRDHGLNTGAFVPTIPQFLKSKEEDRAVLELCNMIKEIENKLKQPFSTGGFEPKSGIVLQ